MNGVLVTLTEDSTDTFSWHCENCDQWDASDYLDLVARWAREHVNASGHTAIIERKG